jgi:thiamine-phosphate pyrophosphorylase
MAQKANKGYFEITMKFSSPFGFYAILTNPVIGYGRLTGILVKYNVPFIQLRMKDAPRNDVWRTAKAMRTITAGSNTKLIINDNPKLAAEIGADGVHLGQSDMSYAEARAIVGESAIIGLSTHSLDQVKSACALSPDYIGVGPVFATPTKKNPDPVIGVDGMKDMIEAAGVPAVAIGGINTENLGAVIRAGAKNFSLVRPLNESRDAENALKQILECYRIAMAE